MTEYYKLCEMVAKDIQSLNEIQNLERLRAYILDSEALNNVSEEIYDGAIWWPNNMPKLNDEALAYLLDHIHDMPF